MTALAGPPQGPVRLPEAVRRLAGGRRAVPVWENEAGGLTVEIGGRLPGEGHCFVKWAPSGSGLDLAAEAERFAWAADYVPVPTVLERGGDEEGSWLVTAALPGRNAATPRWRAHPALAAAAAGRALRALHDSLPVASCPFSWRAERRIEVASRAGAAGGLDPARWHEEHRHLGVDGALAAVAVPPPPDRLVVCHGDPCVPNLLLGESGQCCGYVDLGSLGVADRWSDLAVASWSCDWNYGAGFAPQFFAAYGVQPDAERIAYYRLLWDLGP